MAIHPECDMCKKELTAPGALIFSPPYDGVVVRKFHICRSCYHELTNETGFKGELAEEIPEPIEPPIQRFKESEDHLDIEWKMMSNRMKLMWVKEGLLCLAMGIAIGLILAYLIS